jgi:hypothetical protein
MFAPQVVAPAETLAAALVDIPRGNPIAALRSSLSTPGAWLRRAEDGTDRALNEGGEQ